MSELSRDARALIVQARKDGPALMGPSAQDRARLREKLAPSWAVEAARPRSALRHALGSGALLVGVGWLCWFSMQPTRDLTPAGAVALKTQPAAAAAPSADSERAHASLPPSAAERTATAPTAEAGQRPLAALDDQVAAGKRPSTLRASTRHAPAAESAVAAQRRRAAAAAHDGNKGAVPVNPAQHAAAQGGDLSAVPSSSAQHERAPTFAKGGAPRDQQSAAARASGELPAAEHTPQLASEHPEPSAVPAADSSKRNVRTESRPGPRSIEAELELLGEAQSALQAQRPSRALNLLQDHAFRFPTSALIDERMAMQALALCAMQRQKAAASVLSGLAARGSRSALLPRVRSQCGL